MPRTYYAARYPYGQGAVSATTGRPIRVVHQFLSRAERDAWVADAPTGYRGQSGYRAALRASDVTAREREAAQWYTDAAGHAVTSAGQVI